MPLDRIAIPAHDDLPPLKNMVEQALANRTDLAAEKAGIRTAEVGALGTKNGVLPTLVGFGSESHAGLAGTGHDVVAGPFIEKPNPYFVGGVGTALGQIFRRNFPTESIGAFFQAELRNRQAQADYGIDQLQIRQTQLTTQKDLKQAQVDIMNSVVALQQTRARYDAAVQNRILQQQLFKAEQKKFTLGTSIRLQRSATATGPGFRTVHGGRGAGCLQQCPRLPRPGAGHNPRSQPHLDCRCARRESGASLIAARGITEPALKICKDARLNSWGLVRSAWQATDRQ